MKLIHIFFVTLLLISLNSCGNNNSSKVSITEKDYFITTWNTNNKGISNNYQIIIPTVGGGYNYNIDWGDGEIDINITGDITHTYSKRGIYTVKISGKFPRIYFCNTVSTKNGDVVSTDSKKLLSIEQWGTIEWSSMNCAFDNCSNLVINAQDLPNLSKVKDMSYMFSHAESFNQYIGDWNVSNVTNMEGVFFAARSFNQDIGDWNVSSVINMTRMFHNALSFNYDISSWDVSNVTNMKAMFAVSDYEINKNIFNQDIGDWNISNVTNMSMMFSNRHISTKSYDNILNKWSKLYLKNGVVFDAGESKYSNNASKSRKFIIDNFNWTILDDGLEYNSTATNQAPIAKAEVDKNVSEEGDIITFDASKSSDIDGNIINYQWKEQDVILSNKIKFGKDDLSIGKHSITLTVTDDKNLASSDTVVINVNKKVVTEKDYFITTWKTDKKIDITVSDKYEYNYFIDWGDGKIDYNVTGNASHNYAKKGIYTVKIYGKFPAIYFDLDDAPYGTYDESYINNAKKLISIDQWGTMKWKSMHGAFAGCLNMVLKATDTPNLLHVKDMSYMFYITSKFNQDIGNWDVSNVTNMEGMFNGAYYDDFEPYPYSTFNQDIGSWDVSNVTNMSSMFKNAFEFNQDIGNWNVSNVKNMRSMFLSARDFNQDIGDWNVSNVTNMSSMFDETWTEIFESKFNQDIGDWNVSNVTDMCRMFSGATQFNQDIGNWDVSKVTNMSGMFSADPFGNYKFKFNQDISDWNVSNVTNMVHMFSELSTKNYDNILNKWSTLPLKNNVKFGAGESKYSRNASKSRQFIIDNFNWTISDGGLK